MEPLPSGLYEELLDERLREVLSHYPDLRAVFGKLEPELLSVHSLSCAQPRGGQVDDLGFR